MPTRFSQHPVPFSHTRPVCHIIQLPYITTPMGCHFIPPTSRSEAAPIASQMRHLSKKGRRHWHCIQQRRTLPQIAPQSSSTSSLCLLRQRLLSEAEIDKQVVVRADNSDDAHSSQGQVHTDQSQRQKNRMAQPLEQKIPANSMVSKPLIYSVQFEPPYPP